MGNHPVIHCHRHTVTHHHRHRGSALITILVGNGVGKGVFALITRIGGVDVSAIGVDHHRAMARVSGFAPHVAAVRAGRVVTGQAATHRLVLGGAGGVVHRHGYTVSRAHGDRHRRRALVAILVGDGVGEGIGAYIAGVGRVGVTAVGLDRYAAMAWVGGLAPHVAAIGAGRVVAGQATADGLVLRGAGGIVYRHGHIVDRLDRQRHRGAALVAVLVGDGVGEAVRAVVVRFGRVDEGAVGVHHHRAVLRVGGLGPHVAAVRAGRVVARERAGVRGVLVQREAVIDRHRHLVGREAVDGDGDGCGAGVAVRVGDGVGEGVGQRLAGLQRGHGGVGIVQRVAVGAVRVQRDGAIGAIERRTRRTARDARHRPAHCRAVGADLVVGEGIAHHRGHAARDAAGIVGGLGHVVDDQNAQRAGFRDRR